ncbi:unnamed protein product [Lota lota]
MCYVQYRWCLSFRLSVSSLCLRHTERPPGEGNIRIHQADRRIILSWIPRAIASYNLLGLNEQACSREHMGNMVACVSWSTGGTASTNLAVVKQSRHYQAHLIPTLPQCPTPRGTNSAGTALVELGARGRTDWEVH